MTEPLKIAVVGAGAFGIQHLNAIAGLDEAEVIALVGKDLEETRAIANRYGIAQPSADLLDVLKRPEISAVILCTPTPLHAVQAIA